MGIGTLRRHYAPGQEKKKIEPPPATNPGVPRLPPVSALPKYLEGKTAAEIIALASTDARKSAAPIYEDALEAIEVG